MILALPLYHQALPCAPLEDLGMLSVDMAMVFVDMAVLMELILTTPMMSLMAP